MIGIGANICSHIRIKSLLVGYFTLGHHGLVERTFVAAQRIQLIDKLLVLAGARIRQGTDQSSTAGNQLGSICIGSGLVTGIGLGLSGGSCGLRIGSNGRLSGRRLI